MIFRLINILILASLITAPSNFSWALSGNSCENIFSTEIKKINPSEEDFTEQLLKDPELLNKFLRKRRSQMFMFPEFKTVTSQMKAELDRVPERLNKAKGNRMVASWLKLRAKLIKYKIIFNETFITNHTAIVLAFDFAWIMRSVVLYENKNPSELTEGGIGDIHTYLNGLFLFRAGLSKARDLSREYNIIFVPTFVNLSMVEMTSLWNRGIMPIGLATDIVEFDGMKSHPLYFAFHDVEHANYYLKRSTSVFNFYFYNNSSFDTIFLGKIKRMHLARKNFEKNAQIFEYLHSRLNQYKLNQGFIEFDGGRATRNEIEYILFQITHERESMLILATSLDIEKLTGNIFEVTRGLDYVSSKYRSLEVGEERTFFEYIHTNTTEESQSTAAKWITHHILEANKIIN